MPNLNDICQTITGDLDYVTAAAVIERNSALLLGLGFKSENFTLDYFETVAAAAVNIYQGRNIRTVEKMIADMRGVTPTSCIEEVHLVMKNNSVFISPIIDKPEMLFFLMTTDDIDIELVWSNLRSNLDVIAAAV